MMKTLLLGILLISNLFAFAQSPRNQYNFAQTYFGAQGSWLTHLKTDNNVLSSPDFGAGRLIVGGTHFWRKADFYVSFPLYSSSLESDDWQYSEGVITGGRYLPLSLTSRYPTPYVGVQWIVPGFKFRNGPVLERSKLGLEAGLSMVFAKSWTVETGVHYLFNHEYDYYTSEQQRATAELPDMGLDLSIKKYFDFTRPLKSEAAQRYVKRLKDTLQQQGNLSTWSLSAGPSSTNGISKVPFASQYEFLRQSPGIFLNPDFGIGYYSHPWDLAFRISYRPVSFSQKAFNVNLIHRQQQLAFEVFKFLFDYNGFVPFLGVNGGMTHYQFKVIEDATIIAEHSEWIPSYGITFGWDIRPTDTEWLLLRTNLRYIPPLGLSVQDMRITASQLEFNFIQVVVYPFRLKTRW